MSEDATEMALRVNAHIKALGVIGQAVLYHRDKVQEVFGESPLTEALTEIQEEIVLVCGRLIRATQDDAETE